MCGPDGTGMLYVAPALRERLAVTRRGYGNLADPGAGYSGCGLTVLPVGTAYAVWTGVGALGTVLLGIACFGESATPARLGCIALVVAGVVGLKLLPT